jgi:hypothetical protein
MNEFKKKMQCDSSCSSVRFVQCKPVPPLDAQDLILAWLIHDIYLYIYLAYKNIFHLNKCCVNTYKNVMLYANRDIEFYVSVANKYKHIILNVKIYKDIMMKVNKYKYIMLNVNKYKYINTIQYLFILSRLHIM